SFSFFMERNIINYSSDLAVNCPSANRASLLRTHLAILLLIFPPSETSITKRWERPQTEHLLSNGSTLCPREPRESRLKRYFTRIPTTYSSSTIMLPLDCPGSTMVLPRLLG